ncbi:MAG: hypothetical protein KDJ29_16835, partial [Hyphomicrobiales bacterium]|nr:hypothetical protein [Hyphomicrobiales bacterium]
MAESGDDLNVALTLYERNTKLAECLYTPLQSLEICLRNTVDVQMGRIYGLDWLANGSAPLNRYAQDKIQEAIDKAPRGGHGDWVAELKFSFWVSLAGPSYDATIWRRSLHACFRSGGGRP